MLDRLTALFTSRMKPHSDESGAAPSTDASYADGAALRLAACALLLEVAYADDDFSEDERRHLQGAIRRQFGLDRDAADELIAVAETERSRSVDLWRFTSLVKEHYSKAQLVVLAEVMWGLVYSDGELADREDTLMRRISNLLDLEVGYLSQAQRRAREGFPGGVNAPGIGDEE